MGYTMADAQFYHECSHELICELVTIPSGGSVGYLTHPVPRGQVLSSAIKFLSIDGVSRPISMATLQENANGVVPVGLSGVYVYIDLSPYINSIDKYAARPSFALVSYTTTQDFCPICGGSGIYRGLSLGTANGDMRNISSFDLLAQNMQKILGSNESSNAYHEWFGTQLSSYLGMKIPADDTTLRSEIAAEVQSTLENKLADVWSQAYSSGIATPSEVPAYVTDVTVTRSPRELTAYVINATVKSRDGQNVQLTQILEIGGEVNPSYQYLP